MPTSSAIAVDFAASIVDDVQELAVLPEVTSRILATVDDPDSTPRDLYHIIERDPSLVSKVLKLVNSSFYARSHPIDSVERAIVLLGFDAIYNLAVAASMGRLFRGVRLCETFTARDLWTHSVAVAVTARELARRTHRHLAEEAFLAGLMHDVGLLVALEAYPVKLSKLCQTASNDVRGFIDLEQRIVGIDHQQLGGELARRWRFPPAVQATITSHHQLENSHPFQEIVSLVHVADVLCCNAGDAAHPPLGFNLTAIRQPISESAIRHVAPRAAEDVSAILVELVTPALDVFA